MKRLERFLGKSVKSTIRGSLWKSYVKLTKNSVLELDFEKLERAKKIDVFFGFNSNTNTWAVTIIDNAAVYGRRNKLLELPNTI
jgi:hypothetical protein